MLIIIILICKALHIMDCFKLMNSKNHDWLGHVSVFHYITLEILQGSALERFSEKICYHFSCRAILNIDVANVYSILNKEICDVYMAGVAGTRIPVILLHFDCTLIAMIEDFLIYIYTLNISKIDQLDIT